MFFIFFKQFRNLICYITLLLVTLLAVTSSSSTWCSQEELALYRVKMQTFWSVKRFPKQYPHWRPHAQWSKVIGCAHNDAFRLWRLGDTASDGLKVFVETGTSDDIFDGRSQGKEGVLDAFSAPAISTGVGETEVDVFLDSNHTKVSLVSRVIPSPDWFVGIDSLDLCSRGNWIDTLRVEVGPVDAGTDAGFTFTAPDWESKPRLKISQITAHHPSHPANSFYYPTLQELPPLAAFHLTKVSVYNLNKTIFVEGTNNSQSTIKETTDQRDNQSQQEMLNETYVSQDNNENSIEKSSEILYGNSPLQDLSDDPSPSIFRIERLNKLIKKRNRMRFDKLRRQRPRPCKVSQWSDWSNCSRTCGFGYMTRIRKILRKPKHGGKSCPKLVATRWCGSARNCRSLENSYFRW
ncbi:spondin-2-like [Tachypleus tridentatus]|uniref:spondin-2-like n=1 Tax=Tachypleus tridentatus TaxID=6853 RepID=UPI003FD10B20